MMTEIPIIAVKSQYDQVLAFFNNSAPKAMHFKNDRLHEYVKGNASQFTFKTAANHPDSQYLVEGNRLAFRWDDKDYDLNIVKVVRDEKVVEITAYSTMFELLYETRREYTGNSMTFEQYLNVFDPEHVLVLGINEVSSAKISNKWEGTQTILARLFSLATVFSAELEFVTELNDDYTLKQVTLNVYKEYSVGLNQGIGQNRSDVILKYGKGITGITKTSDISDGIYTAILAYGKDGLSINDIERNWYNEDGNLKYFTRKGQPRIYAPLARDNFPSNLFASENERYIGYEANDTEYTSQEALLGYMLSELKKLSAPEVTYEIDGKFNVDVGDTIIVEDDGYNPTLYLSVRVAETEKSLSNPSIRKAVISNVKELSSEIDDSLLAQVQALIEANKAYNFEILTSSGIIFKNGIGSTTLTAHVRDGIKEITDAFSLKWYKDGILFSNTKTVTINAADIEEKAVFRFEVADDSGSVRGGAEVTITNVDDGKEGEPGKAGADAYTVFLTNESYTFAGSTTAALTGSTTTEVIVYKGINKITPTSITVGTKPTGLCSSVSGSIITLTATTALVSKSGTVPITIIADGKTFTKQFAYSISFQGGKGDKGDKGNTGDKGDTGDTGKGVAAEEISYAISQDGTTPPTSGWSGTRPTPKAGWYMWTRTRFKYTDNTYSAYFYLVAQQGKDAIIISATPPTNPAKEDLWQDPNDATSTVYKWDGTSWVRWGIAIDNLIASNVQIENGVFKRVEGTVIVGSKFVNSFSYTEGGVTYTGSTNVENGNVVIARTGSDGSTWTTSLDRSLGFQDAYKASATAPARTTQLGQGKLYMAESGVGGYLPAAALNPASWTNLSYSSGFTTAENNPCQYRKVQLVDGSWELQLRGQIKPTSGDFSTTASPTGGVLPAGFRPTRNELVPAADSTKKGARVVVLADGQIQLNTPNGGNYVSFGGIRIAL